jgi:hypothetical protein
MSTAFRPDDLHQAWAAMRKARQRLEQVEVQFVPLKDQFEAAERRWAFGLVSERGGSAMPNWDAMEYAQKQLERCHTAIAGARAAFELSLQRCREVFAGLAGDRLPQLVALNERGPVLYQHGLRTDDWAPYQALRTTAHELYQQVVSGAAA